MVAPVIHDILVVTVAARQMATAADVVLGSGAIPTAVAAIALVAVTAAAAGLVAVAAVVTAAVGVAAIVAVVVAAIIAVVAAVVVALAIRSVGTAAVVPVAVLAVLGKARCAGSTQQRRQQRGHREVLLVHKTLLEVHCLDSSRPPNPARIPYVATRKHAD